MFLSANIARGLDTNILRAAVDGEIWMEFGALLLIVADVMALPHKLGF